MNLLNSWDAFIGKIVPYMNNEAAIKDKWSLSLLSSLNGDLNTGKNNFFIVKEYLIYSFLLL